MQETGIKENTQKVGEDKKEETVSKDNKIEEVLSEEIKEQYHEEAKAKKEEGNALFKKNDLEAAVDIYSIGIDKCPECFTKTLSVLYANRAACYVHLEEKDLAIKDCTLALEKDKFYTKARLRRAELYEATEKLDEALADYNEILTYDKGCHRARAAGLTLPGRIKERNEKLKEEMFGKLKDLGNMCLKPFGLSTENFKVNQDPNTGGYSVNFQQ